MTAPFKVERLDHVNITTPQELEDEVLEWYESCLGLERIDKPDGTHPAGGWFQAGEGQIHVSGDEHNPPRTAHFALIVSDLDSAVERLRSSGCHIEQARQIPGVKRFYTRDPAGNRIELMCPTEEGDA